MSTDIRNTFKEKIYECDKHVEKIASAKRNLKKYFPLTSEVYSDMNEISISFIDQLIFRFSKLQDTLGESIFPSILILGEEDVKRKTFIDILNRLEELEIIDRNRWLELREVRNEIAHEYSFNTEEVVGSISDVYEKCDEMLVIYNRIKAFCENKFGFEYIKK